MSDKKRHPADCIPQNPSLEDLLNAVMGDYEGGFFLEKPEIHPDGSRRDLTERGSVAYRRLVGILCGIAHVVDDRYFTIEVENAIEKMDDIIRR